jgi:hypothetical protein
MGRKNIYESEFDDYDEADGLGADDNPDEDEDPDGEADDSDEDEKNDEAMLDGKILDDANFCDAKPSNFNSTDRAQDFELLIVRAVDV